MELDIPTAVPLVYELDAELKPIRHYYLRKAQSILSPSFAFGTPETHLWNHACKFYLPVSKEELEKRMQAVKNQGKATAPTA